MHLASVVSLQMLSDVQEIIFPYGWCVCVRIMRTRKPKQKEENRADFF